MHSKNCASAWHANGKALRSLQMMLIGCGCGCIADGATGS